MNKKIILSIIIVTWNTKDLLKNCIQSLMQSSNELKFEIIVVDNDSKDGTSDMLRNFYPTVRLINSGGNIGFGRANNLALPLIQSPNVLFLNPDTIIKTDVIKQMLDRLFTNLTIGVVGCKIIDRKGKIVELPFQITVTPLKMLFLQILPFKLLKNIYPYQDPLQSGYVKNLFGACFMVRKEVLDQVGYFDELFFMYAEDIDLCQRIHAAGWHLYYLADADIIHLEGGASDKAPSEFSILMMCESTAKLMKKNYGRKGELIYKFGVFISSFSRLLLLSLCNIRSLFSSSNKYLSYIQQRRKHLIALKWCLKI